MQKVVDFQDFCLKCPYLYTYEEENLNNGFNCSHPEQREFDYADESEEIKIGYCYCFSCPLGREASIDDWTDNDIDWDGYLEKGENPNGYYLIIETDEQEV